ncbi:MAG: PAAT family amino acid ABC transporter substrate-binding protein [Pseudomonas stutzeri]|nr:PAAT family amino acid ABC transporter substrate-binding protein [Stutzerimonas stutzeri]
MQRLLRVLVLSLLPLACMAQQPVEVWTYHLSPPFKVDASRGLSQEFVDLLNHDPANAGRFRFELVELPRKRLDMRLANHSPGILLWATPQFFSAALTAKATWTQALLLDQQSFVSLPDTAFEYERPQSLKGLILGGVLGYRYEGLEKQIASGAIRRQDAQTDLQNLQKLLSGRIDTLLIAHSTLLYYHQSEKLGDLYISEKPLYQFTRHLLITNNLGDAVTGFLDDFLTTLPGNPHWQIILSHYGLQSMVAP